jgi:FKBP-type peptidyl-prolyl cis-trans isomerase FklB
MATLSNAAGEQFLAANAARPEVTTTASGLQYEILEMGSGARPGPRSMVVTHYHGTLVDGTVFDSSVTRGQPASFGVHQVISAWTEALQLMTVGSKWRIACPPNLAYGERGAGGVIGPNATLVFEIQLLDIKG